MPGETLAFAFASIGLLMAAGSISQETSGLRTRARHDAEHDALTGLLSRNGFRARVDLGVPFRRPIDRRR